MKRRQFLESGLLAAGGLVLSGVSLGQAGAPQRSRLVLVLLRGALDGLAAVPPYGDPAYAALRRQLALTAPGSPGGALELTGPFGLHPSLTFLHESFKARELVVFHAVASAYRERSHFDGQDVLESGLTLPHGGQTGWLNRALAALPTGSSGKEAGVALGANIPLVMRGPAEVTSWSPTKLAAVDEDTLTRIADLYTGDPLLAARLAEAVAADTLLKNDDDPAAGAPAMGATQADTHAQNATMIGTGSATPPKAARYTEVVRAAARFLAREDGPQVAAFDTTGWDTHAGEGAAQGQLAVRLRVLDEALSVLKTELGARWADTAVLLVTEFGRTAAINGTQGTDHGTATCAFLVGGAVQGGRVVADWPGLSPGSLYQSRDLKPTLDLRAVMKGVLQTHLKVPAGALARSVFPDSEHVKPLEGLVRA
jgi:uncharacterized protein (DUF1501 family)